MTPSSEVLSKTTSRRNRRSKCQTLARPPLASTAVLSKVEVLQESKVAVLQESRLEVLQESKVEVLREGKVEVLQESKVEAILRVRARLLHQSLFH